MDMPMSNSTSSNSTEAAMMTNFITTLGMSNIWFAGWTPETAASTFGACVGIFFLATFSRFLSAVSVALHRKWEGGCRQLRQEFVLATLKEKSESIDGDQKTVGYDEGAVARVMDVPPFILKHDLPRGILFMFQAFVGYMLMLVVMTYNAWFFIAILLGMCVGEITFGRWMSGSASL